jgi:hypothetical protein
MSLAVKTTAAPAAVMAQVKHVASSACKTGCKPCNMSNTLCYLVAILHGEAQIEI